MTGRKSIYIEGFSHKNPIPAACLVDRLLVSGIIYGFDPETGKAAETIEAQCRWMFRHLRSVLAEAGATADDLVKLNVYLRDRSQRDALNREWIAMFPEPENRPARQTMEADLDGGKLIQCDFIAWMKKEGREET
jgi:2-iminobutanoate/2-iminopropanoate deaminase